MPKAAAGKPRQKPRRSKARDRARLDRIEHNTTLPRHPDAPLLALFDRRALQLVAKARGMIDRGEDQSPVLEALDRLEKEARKYTDRRLPPNGWRNNPFIASSREQEIREEYALVARLQEGEAVFRDVWQPAIERVRPDIIRGREAKDRSSKGGKRKAESASAHHAEWQREADKVWERNAGVTRWHVAQKIAPLLGKSASRIHRVIKKPG